MKGGYRKLSAPASRLPAHRATGHWRAINPGVVRSMTVTSGASGSQVSVVRGPDLLVSQADSAGSIPVTRSTKAQLKPYTTSGSVTSGSRPVPACPIGLLGAPAEPKANTSRMAGRRQGTRQLV